MAVLPLTVRPLQTPPGSSIDFGAEIQGVDLENLTGSWIPTYCKSTN
jgi:hypothetical protein